MHVLWFFFPIIFISVAQYLHLTIQQLLHNSLCPYVFAHDYYFPFSLILVSFNFPFISLPILNSFATFSSEFSSYSIITQVRPSVCLSVR